MNDSKERLKELKRNTIIIAASNIGSKAIAFILAPLYSYYLTTSQYGTMDLVTTTVSFLSPLFCLDIYEATFRFVNDEAFDKRKVLATSLFVCIPGAIVIGLISVGALFLSDAPSLILYSCVFIFLNSISHIMAQFLRGSGKMKSFALSGIVNSVFLLGSNIVFLVLLKLELSGWMISFLIGKLAMTSYCCFSAHRITDISIRDFDNSYLSEFLKYCFPLLPTAMMWWIMNASDRYMLTFFIGTSITGIYAVANKLPSLLSIFENVFYQAFQTSGINDLNNKGRDVFYSRIFNGYISFLGIGILSLLVILKPITQLLFESAYSDAWLCTSILTVGVLFHALAGNLGSYYVIFKKTNGALITSVIGAGTNIVLNAFFIPYFGMIGAASTTLIGYIVTMLIRWKDVKKMVNLSINKSNVLIYSAAIVVQLSLYYVPGFISYGVRIVIVAALLIKEKDMLLKLIKH